jgi:outer membrane protein
LVLVAASLAQNPAPAPATPAPAAAAPVPAAPSSGPAPTKIGIINIQGAIIATNEGQRDFQNLEKKFEPKRVELQNANSEVERLKDQLTKQGDKLNEATRAELIKSIDLKSKALQRAMEDAQTEWGTQQNDIGNRIGAKMVEILEKYSTENGYAIVLDVSSQTSPVIWANAATNVTKAIVDAYNAQSNVPPPPPTAASAPAPKPAAPAAAKPAAAKPAASGTTPKQ